MVIIDDRLEICVAKSLSVSPSFLSIRRCPVKANLPQSRRIVREPVPAVGKAIRPRPYSLRSGAAAVWRAQRELFPVGSARSA